MFRRTLVLTALFVALPSSAHAATETVPTTLAVGSGLLALISAAVLLGGMYSLAKVAEGAVIARNISYAILAVICLAASVLMSWIARWVPEFSAEHARLGADLLSVIAMTLFGVYFLRVRRAMLQFLRQLTGEQQLLATAIDPDEAGER